MFLFVLMHSIPICFPIYFSQFPMRSYLFNYILHCSPFFSHVPMHSYTSNLILFCSSLFSQFPICSYLFALILAIFSELRIRSFAFNPVLLWSPSGYYLILSVLSHSALLTLISEVPILSYPFNLICFTACVMSSSIAITSGTSIALRLKRRFMSSVMNWPAVG